MDTFSPFAWLRCRLAPWLEPSVGRGMRARLAAAACAVAGAVSGTAWAGAQVEEPLADSVRTALSAAIGRTEPVLVFADATQRQQCEGWAASLEAKLLKRKPEELVRREFLQTVCYEAKRAGLEPGLVLGLIQVESGFKKYAVSSAGARGFMQIMPFWVQLIGSKENNLFHLRTNLRYGCTILRHYLDIEKGDLYRALGRYNGSLGRPEYPTLVVGAWRNHWSYNAPGTRITSQDEKRPAS